MQYFRPLRLLYLACLTAISGPATGHAQVVPLLDPTMIDASVESILPHRLELEETTVVFGGTDSLDAWVYVTVDHSQAWNERHLMVNWTALTWNGTGFDLNLAAAPNLALRARVTPRGIPFGQLIESHYYPGQHNRSAVNPDGEVRRHETVQTDPGAVYNEILWPYVLSRLDLAQGDRFILPGYSPYRAQPFFFRRFHVLERVEVQDDEGNTFEGWRVDAVGRATLKEAQEVSDGAAGRHAVYLVSHEAPYFLGKEVVEYDEDGHEGEAVKRWRLTAHRILDLSPANRMEEILRVRETRGADQELPWRP
ncbi:MAG: hypothetical protein ABFS14_07035 [Gemmatimonadota bacterium]